MDIKKTNQVDRTQFSCTGLALSLVCCLIAVASPASAKSDGQNGNAKDPRAGFSSFDITKPTGATDLQDALSRLARNSRDVIAMIDAGKAALQLQDARAAVGFFARAEQIAPRNGFAKAGLGSAILFEKNPFEALRLFDQAVKLGVPRSYVASDRGLAFDLIGNNQLAQQDYRLALASGKSDELLRRYAVSLGISGKREEAEAALNPLLQKRDPAAWRARAFILAMNGDRRGANVIIDATMPKKLAAAVRPFMRQVPKLSSAQRAAAIHFGHFPSTSKVGVDLPRVQSASGRQYASASATGSDLIPSGRPLGAAPQTKQKKINLTSRAPRRRPGSSSGIGKFRQFSKINSDARLNKRLAKKRKKKTNSSLQSVAVVSQGPAFESVNKVVSGNVGIAQTKNRVTANLTPVTATQLAEVDTSMRGGTQKNFPAQVAPKPVVQTVAATPQTTDTLKKTKVSISDILDSIEISKGEQNQSVVAVDLQKIQPAVDKPKKVKPKVKKPKHPKRYWAQIASGRNIKAMKYDWKRLSKKASSSFKGKSSWTAPLGRTNRLLAGPFKTSKSAQSFVNAIKKKGISAIAWTSPKGQEVKKLKTK